MRNPPLILCIDDNKTIILFLVALLSRNGFQTVTAYDGLEGLDKMRKYQPDLTLLDINMPKLTGFDVALAAANDPFLKNIPIIILSALSQVNNKERIELKNVYNYLTKPVNTSQLLLTIQSALSNTKASYA
ncbi:MAG: response regulator [Sulfuricurvum sp.]|nr:response regulator [Sulfuricurvum sp.]MDD5387144.1 response regulator [Sulfuricurvum sp.]